MAIGAVAGGAGLGIGYGSGGWTFGLGGYYDSFYEPPKSINLSRGGAQSLEDEDILPDGRMLWELSDEEFSMFHTAEGRRALFGGDFDIQLHLAERAYWYGKQLGLAMPTAKVSGFQTLSSLKRAKNGELMFQVGVRHKRSNYQIRLERHSFNTNKGVPVFRTHVNYGIGGINHWYSFKS